MREKTIDEELREHVGKDIDITVVHHVEGRSLRTSGKLLEVNENYIKLELEYRNHFWERYRKGIYVCNRKTCSLLSFFSA